MKFVVLLDFAGFGGRDAAELPFYSLLFTALNRDWGWRILLGQEPQ